MTGSAWLTQLQTSGFLGFADDTSEVLHVNSAGLNKALDPVSRQLRNLFQLPPEHLGEVHFGAHYRTASLLAADQQLFVLSDRQRSCRSTCQPAVWSGSSPRP